MEKTRRKDAPKSHEATRGAVTEGLESRPRPRGTSASIRPRSPGYRESRPRTSDRNEGGRASRVFPFTRGIHEDSTAGRSGR
jgi:hypothetical protein